MMLCTLMPGGTLSSLKGPAVMLGAQCPATSHAWPEAISTAEPLVVVERVKGDCAGVASPEVASEAVKPALWVPRHQPLVPGSVQASAAALRARVGATLSSLTVVSGLVP